MAGKSLCDMDTVLSQDESLPTKKEAFSHEWTGYPFSLFEPDACWSQGYKMRNGNK